MPSASPPLQVLLLFSLLYFLSLSSSSELQALLQIKAHLQNPSANVFSTWVSTNSPCNFTGITCNTDGLVTEIELSSQHLTGTLPLDSICKLQSLSYLSLGNNSLGGPVTDDLRYCSNLRYLDLGNNFFSGPVPDISQLNKLKYLYLNCSGFSGKFPWNSISNMSDIVVLSLGDNPFDRSPLPGSLFQLTNLNWLYLSNCSIEGKIDPKIGNLSELINLELSQNYLFGEIPQGISKLSKLWQLELYRNDLTGKIPVGFRNLTVLENFDASRNNLGGDLSELRSLTQLVSLQLYENNFSGQVPAEFGVLKKIVSFSLYSNRLTGPLPQSIGSWSKFDFIDVSENFLTGPIPPDMCKQGTMTELLMLQNGFSGNIPATYASCKSLTRFRVSKNSLTGVVPSGILGLPRVGMLDLASNEFEGSITSAIGKAEALTQLHLYNNRFSGQIPSEISEATALMEIDLSYNQFTGDIPMKIGNLRQLNKLYLQNNMFSGPIPKTLASCVALNNINMAQNSFSGKIPSSIGSLPALNSLNLSENNLSGQIPATLSSLKLSILDLSYNKLFGPIPQTLSVEAYNGSFVGNSGLCSQSIGGFQRCSLDSGNSHDDHIIVIIIASIAILFFVSVLCILFLNSKAKKDEERSLKDDSWDIKSFHVLSFTEDDILDSIKQENLIGKGGSGNVYKVVLSNKKELAVKHIWNSGPGDRRAHRNTAPMLSRSARKLKEFEAEVQTLSSIRHVNVVKLYCSITSEDSSLLVYEYLPNGNLYDRLHHSVDKLALDWDTRYEIAIGAAKGLAYLHHGCDRPVIHRDVKSSNILLDEFFKPRIADFGLAKIVQIGSDADCSTHVIAGTPGYIAPEYGYTYKVNEKSDVYSFGVVLLELVTGRRPIEPDFGENKDVVSWVSSKLKNKKSVFSIVDPVIPEGYREEAIKVLRIAILCTATELALRPTMRSVVQMLEEAEPCKLVGIIVGKNGSEKEEGKEVL